MDIFYGLLASFFLFVSGFYFTKDFIQKIQDSKKLIWIKDLLWFGFGILLFMFSGGIFVHVLIV